MAFSNYDILLFTFLFNLLVIFIFAMIYGNISQSNFKHMSSENELTYVDYFFYAITIQCGVGLPDITAVTNLAKILASIQQVVLMATGFIVASLLLK